VQAHTKPRESCTTRMTLFWARPSAVVYQRSGSCSAASAAGSSASKAEVAARAGVRLPVIEWVLVLEATSTLQKRRGRSLSPRRTSRICQSGSDASHCLGTFTYLNAALSATSSYRAGWARGAAGHQRAGGAWGGRRPSKKPEGLEGRRHQS